MFGKVVFLNKDAKNRQGGNAGPIPMGAMRGGIPSTSLIASGLLVPGILCIAFGVLILLKPELLVAMVATFFIFIGVLLLSVSLGARKMAKRADRLFDDNSFDKFS